ncbi:MAG: hypothetical protein ACKOFV_04110 [Candidatus Nanopelagicaceae bacterium]
MRRALISAFSISLFLFNQPVNAAPSTKVSVSAKAGSTCSKLNQTQIVNDLKFTCIKSGKKLIWNKGVKIVKPKPVLTPTLALGPTLSPPSNEISVFKGSAPLTKKNIKQSFELKVSIAPAKSDSNLKLYIYDPENPDKMLGSPGIFYSKNGGNWQVINSTSKDGSLDAKLDAGNYLIDIIEPNGNATKYERGRYTVNVEENGTLSIAGLLPNSTGYFTVTSPIRKAAVAKPVFTPTSKCQLLDKTGSTNMSNGFPRADKRLPNRGVIKALIIPVEFTDLVGSGSPAEVYREMAKGTADFYYKQSQQTVRFEFTTLPEYVNLKVPVTSFNLGSYNGGDPNSYFMAGLRAVESIIDISNFDIAYVLPPKTVKARQIAYGPAFPASLDSGGYQNATGTIYNGTVGGQDAWQELPGATWKWMAHETGHTFGLYDWYTLDGKDPYGPWDIMSLNWTTEAIELNAWNRYISGWLAESQVQCFEAENISSTPKNLKIETLALDSNKSKAVMIKLSDSKILVIEARATAGLDELSESRTGLVAYTVDTTIPSIKGMGKTIIKDGGTDPRYAALKPGEFVIVDGIQVKAGAKKGHEFEVVISK